MESFISLAEFFQTHEPYMYAIMIYCMVVFSGVFVFINVAADLGFLLYRSCKKGVVVLWRKLKKK